MPTNVAVNDILQVECIGGSNVTRYENVLHYRVSLIGGAGLTDQVIAQQLGTLFGPIYRAYMAAGSTYDLTRVTIISPVAAPFWESPLGAGVGMVADDEIPAQNAMVITKRSSAAGRSKRGRVYLFGWPEDANDADGNPTNVALANGATWAATVLAPVNLVVGGNTVQLQPAIWSRKLGTSADLADYIIRPFWATMRRRSQLSHSYHS